MSFAKSTLLWMLCASFEWEECPPEPTLAPSIILIAGGGAIDL